MITDLVGANTKNPSTPKRSGFADGPRDCDRRPLLLYWAFLYASAYSIQETVYELMMVILNPGYRYNFPWPIANDKYSKATAPF